MVKTKKIAKKTGRKGEGETKKRIPIKAGRKGEGETKKRIPIKHPKFKLENVVASISLGVELDLESISARLEKTEYEPEQFPGLILRLDTPSSAVLVFRSGKMVCTGARSPEAIYTAVKEAIVKLETVPKIKIPKKYEVTIQNMVASSDLGCDLNLDKIAFTMDNAEFEPEQFPGLVYRMSQPRVVFLLFRSGRIICTGAKFEKDVKTAIKKLQKELKEIDVM